MKRELWYDLIQLTDYVNRLNDKYSNTEDRIGEILQPLLKQLWELQEQVKNKGTTNDQTKTY